MIYVFYCRFCCTYQPFLLWIFEEWAWRNPSLWIKNLSKHIARKSASDCTVVKRFITDKLMVAHMQLLSIKGQMLQIHICPSSEIQNAVTQ